MNKRRKSLYVFITGIMVLFVLLVMHSVFTNRNITNYDISSVSEEKKADYIYVKNEEDGDSSYEIITNTYSSNSISSLDELKNNHEIATDILDVSIDKKSYSEELFENDITTEYKQFNNVSDMLSADILIGENVETLGYYMINDGGSARYEITNEKANGFNHIKLDNGNTASLVSNNPSVKQIGAYGDGLHDDTEYLRWLFNSDYENIRLDLGEYKCTDKIEIKIGNKTIEGNNSKIVTNNDYVGKAWCVLSIRANDVSVKNLTMEALEKSIVLYKGQLEIKNCSNVSLNNCSFIVPNTVIPYDAMGNTKQYTNVDLNGGWHNITISNCTFSNLSGGLAGSCIWVRDMEGNGASDLVLKDCSLIKSTHDESLAIFHGSIKNVLVDNNYFEGRNEDKLSSPTDFCISVGNEKSSMCDNIQITNNTFIGSGENFLITFGNMTNVLFAGNYFDFTKIGTSKFFLVWKLNNCTPGIPVFNNNIFNIHSEMAIDKLFAIPVEYCDNKFYIDSANLKKNYIAEGSVDNGGNSIFNSEYVND